MRCSLKPQLGNGGITALASEMGYLGHVLEEPLNGIKLEGTYYPFDNTLRTTFEEVFIENGGVIKGKGDNGIGDALKRHSDYIINCKFGDPISKQARLVKTFTEIKSLGTAYYGQI